MRKAGGCTQSMTKTWTMQLSGNISEGSFFRNGEITLEFKGLSIVDDVACAIVGFDSGDSSFKFHIKPTPDMEIKLKPYRKEVFEK